jgi:hypothetical protein
MLLGMRYMYRIYPKDRWMERKKTKDEDEDGKE